jgi:hypothetical protein
MRRITLALVLAAALVPSGSLRLQAAPTPADLDKMLAPIALYPDSLLAQMLLAAGNPGRVSALNEWLASHETLKGTALQDAAVAAGFEGEFAALTLFPQVVNYMASQAQWTASLGKAFAADRSAVFESIQRLRTKAKNAGTLKSTPQQQVETQTTSSGQQVIVIEPTNPQIVYVPQYNAQTVYTTPTTVVVKEDNSAEAALAGVIGFTAGIAIGAAFDNNYYYGPYGWGGGVHMYNDAWDDWYDEREDAREDWMDHREDMNENRSERAEDARENRSDRSQSTQQQRTERSQNRTEAAGTRTAGTTAAGTSQEARGYSKEGATTSSATRDRSGTKSDAFSGYSSGKSERAASQRGNSSRSSSRSSGGSRRR